jgi:general secretion pathway protein G
MCAVRDTGGVRRARGFTLIELMVVMAIIALLLSIAAPRYFKHVDRAREAALRETLAVVRDSIDKFHGDTGRYPADLEELVKRHYLARLPVDPMSEGRDSWVTVPLADEPGIWDLHSGAGGEGQPYADW